MAVTINGVSPTTAQQREFAAAMGLPVLLQTVTVASAQQDIDFTGLNLDADRIYRIEMTLVTNASEDQSVRVFYNTDFTDVNYQSQFILAGGATSSVARAATATALFGAVMSAGLVSVGYCLLSKIPGKAPSLVGTQSIFDNANIALITRSAKWNGTANVTSIKLRHTTLFGVGTVAKIYKV